MTLNNRRAPEPTLTAVFLRRLVPLVTGSGVQRHLQLEGACGLRSLDQFSPSRVRETLQAFQRTLRRVIAYSRLVSRATTTSADSCALADTVVRLAARKRAPALLTLRFAPGHAFGVTISALPRFVPVAVLAGCEGNRLLAAQVCFAALIPAGQPSNAWPSPLRSVPG